MVKRINVLLRNFRSCKEVCSRTGIFRAEVVSISNPDLHSGSATLQLKVVGNMLIHPQQITLQKELTLVYNSKVTRDGN